MPTRFNPPPGWPPHPRGWTPPPGWQPDPSWPDPPPGWPLWVEETPVSLKVASADSRWVIGGGAAVFLGSLLPFISSSALGGVTVHAGARFTSALFGIILGGLGVALEYLPDSAMPISRPRVYVFGIPALALSILGFLGYVGFTVVGAAGVSQATGLGYSEKVTFSPSIGLIMAILGCAAAGFGAISALRHASAPRLAPPSPPRL